MLQLEPARLDYPDIQAGYPYDEVLRQVQSDVAGKDIGKRDIGALLLWKRLNLSTKWTQVLNMMPDEAVRSITGEAFKICSDASLTPVKAARDARKVLLALPGCTSGGAAVPSTILTAGAPYRMAVYDSRARAALIHLGWPDPKWNYGDYMEIVWQILDAVKHEKPSWSQWCPRDVDKALYVLGGKIERR